MTNVKSIRGITLLNSCGKPAIEVTVELAGGFLGVASGATPLASTARENVLGVVREPIGMEPEMLRAIAGRLVGSHDSQSGFDEKLSEFVAPGSLSIAVSLAFLRAAASHAGQSFLAALLAEYGGSPKLPMPLINVVSGGIHSRGSKQPFQQIMMFPVGEHRSAASCINEGIELYTEIESELIAHGRLLGYSHSSGMLTPFSAEEALDLLCGLLGKRTSGSWAIGLDVAAEHLPENDRSMSPNWPDYLRKLCASYPIRYIEDPFAISNETEWTALKRAVTSDTMVVGDDLFVSQSRWVRSCGNLANAVLLKLNQAGTVSALLATARAATSRGLALCTSHRSCETEDQALVEVSIALAARLMKLGGPRRGDRVSRYNHLLRYARSLGQ